jgi:hypothetical protein
MGKYSIHQIGNFTEDNEQVFLVRHVEQVVFSNNADKTSLKR